VTRVQAAAQLVIWLREEEHATPEEIQAREAAA
jgi:hypothetical protein